MPDSGDSKAADTARPGKIVRTAFAACGDADVAGHLLRTLGRDELDLVILFVSPDAVPAT